MVLSTILKCKCGKEYKTDRGYNNHIESCEAMKQKALPIGKKAPTKAKTSAKNVDGFHLKLNESKIFKGVITALSDIIYETTIIISPEKLEISAMDPSRICFIKFELLREQFDIYKCSETYQVPIFFDDFEKILRRTTEKDSIELISDMDAQKIKIRFQRESGRVRNFSLKLIELDYEEIPFDNLEGVEQMVFFDIDADDFNDLLKDAELYSEVLNLKTSDDEELSFSSEGIIGEFEAELGAEELLNLKIHEKAEGTYSSTFLKSFMKLSSVTELVNMEYRTQSFLKMIFNIIEGSKVITYLAPRVDQELDDADIEDLEYDTEDVAEKEIIDEEEETEDVFEEI